jgi:hypothetical protein
MLLRWALLLRSFPDEFSVKSALDPRLGFAPVGVMSPDTSEILSFLTTYGLEVSIMRLYISFSKLAFSVVSSVTDLPWPADFSLEFLLARERLSLLFL